MNIYLLQSSATGWDAYRGFVIIAKDEEEARKLANEEASRYNGENAFLSPKDTCELLGKSIYVHSQIVLEDFING